jgi:hypothetical protein
MTRESLGYLEKGVMAKSSAEQVEKIIRLAREHSLEPATPTRPAGFWASWVLTRSGSEGRPALHRNRAGQERFLHIIAQITATKGA